MNFDKKEQRLNILYNTFENQLSKMEWLLQEMRQSEARYNNAQADLFFAYIHQYNCAVKIEDWHRFNDELEKEFKELNHDD